MGFIFSHFFSPRRILLPSLFFSVPPIVFIYLSIIPDSFNRDPRVACLSFPSLELIIHLLGIQMLFKSSIDIYLHMYMQDKLISRGNQVPKCTCKCRYENQAGKTRGNNTAVQFILHLILQIGWPMCQKLNWNYGRDPEAPSQQSVS